MMLKTTFALASFVAVSALIAGCGVRGNPQPPHTPAELGHGQPSFRRATEEFAFPNVPAPDTAATPAPIPGSSPKPFSAPSWGAKSNGESY